MNFVWLLKLAPQIYTIGKAYLDKRKLDTNAPSMGQIIGLMGGDQRLQKIADGNFEPLEIVRYGMQAQEEETVSTPSSSIDPTDMKDWDNEKLSEDFTMEETPEQTESGEEIIPEGEQPKSFQNCTDCSFKHLSTARVNLQEASQWLNNKEPKEKVMKKIQTAFDQLAGAEEATRMTDDSQIAEINKMIRETRKEGFDSKLPMDVNNVQEINDFYGKVNKIYDKTLEVTKQGQGEYSSESNEMEEAGKRVQARLDKQEENIL